MAALGALGSDALAVRAYFLGNSLTDYIYNVPGLVQQMRTAAGYPDDFVYGSNVIWGGGLDHHWGHAAAHTKLAQGPWDYVVLQDYSLNPTDAPQLTQTYARLWDSEIKTVQPGAVTMMYSLWERTDRRNSLPTINSVNGALATEFGGISVPAGDAFKLARAQRPTIGLYADYVHPTLNGAYLAAAVFYSEFFNQSPVGLAPPSGMTASDALFLQQVAWQTVQTTSTRTLAPDFTYGSWDVAQNWSGQRIPQTGDSVRLEATGAQFRSITYTPPMASSLLSLATLNIQAASGGYLYFSQPQYALNVAGAVSVTGSAGGTSIYSLGPGATLAASSITIGQDGYVSFAHDGSASFSGAVNLLTTTQDSSAYYMMNGGSLTAQSLNLSGNAMFIQYGGTVDIGDQVEATSGSIQLNGGRLEAGEIALSGAAELRASGGRTTIVRTSSLSLSSNSVLDIGDGTLIIDGTAANRAALQAQLSHLLNAARNSPDGLWMGKGLASAAARSDLKQITGLALVLNDDGTGRPFWNSVAGESVDANDWVIRYSYAGDLNLDGRVDIDDYFRIDVGYALGRSGYQNGDINYDGLVNSDDYFLIDRAMFQQSGELSAGLPTPMSVPEPAGLAVLLGAGAIACRRRR